MLGRSSPSATSWLVLPVTKNLSRGTRFRRSGTFALALPLNVRRISQRLMINGGRLGVFARIGECHLIFLDFPLDRPLEHKRALSDWHPQVP
ncbi:MAG: hypothetical protein WD871_13275, partial [Xanthobacteraceae bacterium]